MSKIIKKRIKKKKEDIIKKYINDELVSLKSFININQEKIIIYLEKDKVEINNRDVSIFYKNNKNNIEEKYEILRKYYFKQKELTQAVKITNPKTIKSKRIRSKEEKLRNYIKESFDYKAPLDKRNFEELSSILRMLIKRKNYN